MRKCLVITDIDCCKPVTKRDKNGKERKYIEKTKYDATDDSLVTSNASIKYFLNNTQKVKDILAMHPAILSWNFENKKWETDEKGYLRLAFQYGKKTYQPRSFEDAFFSENEKFITENTFSSLQSNSLEQFKSDKDAYELANNGVSGKSSLAIEILLNSKKEGTCDFSNWKIPTYIKEGLLWLRKN